MGARENRVHDLLKRITLCELIESHVKQYDSAQLDTLVMRRETR